MSKIRFSGLPAGPASIALRQAGQQADLSFDVPQEPLTGDENCFFLNNQPITQNWEGVSVTTKPGNGQNLGWGMNPPVYRRRVQAQADGANRVSTRQFSDFDFLPKVMIGGHVDVYRIQNGDLNLVRQSNVIDGNWGRWSSLAAVDTPGYNFRFDNFNREGVPYWLGVATVDADGLSGDVAEAPYFLPLGANGAKRKDNLNTARIGYKVGGTLPPPTDLTLTVDPDGANGLSLSWSPVAGAEGYIVVIAFSDPANFPDLGYLQLEDDGGVPVKEGDMVILTNRISKPSPDMKSSRVFREEGTDFPFQTSPLLNTMNHPEDGYEYEYFDWSEDEPAPAPAIGTSYARIQVHPTGSRQRIIRYFWAGPNTQTFYRVANPDEIYRFEGWIKADRVVEIQFRFGLTGVPDQTIFLQPGWQRLELEASPTEVRTKEGATDWWGLTVMDTQTPVTLWLANTKFYEASTTGYHLLSQEFADQVTPGMFLRDHSLIKPGNKTTDVATLTNPPGESQRETTLESIFNQCLAAGGQPWLQIEWYHTPDEWLDILAYIAAPVSSGHPMALKRQANGRSAPWTDAFDKIRLEFGNEAWNPMGNFWNPPFEMPDEVTGENVRNSAIYGLICRRAALAMQASPFWTDKIIWVLGGRADSTWSPEIARAFALPCEVGIANYNGGWDVGNVIVQENETSYQNTMGVVPGSTGKPIDRLVTDLMALADEPGFPLEYGTELRATCYEAGPGYQLNGLNGARVTAQESITQEVVMKSRAAGTGTLDTVLYQAEKGFALFNFFTLSSGNLWSSKAGKEKGGGVYPSFALPQLVMDNMGPSSVYKVNPIRPTTFTMQTTDGGFINPDALFIYGLRSRQDAGRFMLIIGNRSISETVPCSILTTMRAASGATAFLHLGDHREHNRYSPGERIDVDGLPIPDPLSVVIEYPAIPIDVPADIARIEIDSTLGLPGLNGGVPPGGVVIIRLDGVVFEGE